MSPTSLDQPYRGDGSDRPTGVPLPPQHLPLLRSRQLRKSWHYVAFWSRELSFCAAQVRVGPLKQEYWGVWDRAAGQFRQASYIFGSRLQVQSNRVRVADGDVEIDVTFDNPVSFEVYRPAGRAYIWSHKDYSRTAKGRVRYGNTSRDVAGVMFVDVNAGYHERHTSWRWAAGAGTDQHGRLIAFNAITGLFDTPTNSERTIWIENEAQEVGPNRFADDLSTVSFAEGGTLTFHPEQLIENHDNYVLIRSDYFHWFGTYSGTLPNGIELREAYGVFERHDAVW
ncbi:MAG: DUF2804 domain-containing protein [Pyrinomonadaceae bacterium]